jgi:NADPH-dependent curcumin reductase CurA
LVFQFADRFQQAAVGMARWIQEGKLKYKEDIVEGFENLPRAFITMLQGDNTGKRLVKV